MHRWSRCTFTIGAAAALLVGCGSASQPPIPAPLGDTQLQALLSSRVVDGAARYSLIYAFRPRDGESPQTLAYHNGDIFGSTVLGGNTSCSCGVVFKLSPAGEHYEYTRLHAFTGGSNDGADPTSLIATSSGSLYGTTAEGGGTGCTYSGYAGCGTIFKLTPTGSKYTYSILYRFKGSDDGYSPDLARGQKITDTGPILGTASGGASKTCGCGFLFKLVRSGDEYTKHLLWSFGRNPGEEGVDAPIAVDGAMYGIAYGNFGAYTYAYRFDSGHFTMLLKFRESDAKKDGRGQRLTASDAAGNLYGAALGGINRCFIGTRRTSCGLVFELVAAGDKYTERVLHRFSPGNDGWSPSVSAYDNGVLYGTTGLGGTACDGNSDGCGVVFALSTGTGKETVLYRFKGGVRGACPCSNLLKSPSESELYGATTLGGHQAGAVFHLLFKATGAINAI
jgi:hypothetical protein